MTNSISKSKIHSSLMESSNLTQEEIENVFCSFFDAITESLAEGVDVKIYGFGNFQVRQKKERIGRNPKNGKEALISSRKSVFFKASGKLIEKISEKQCKMR